MSIFARIQGGTVAELFTPPVGVPLTDCFHVDLWPSWVEVSGIAPQPEAGWSAAQSGGAWTFAPPAPVVIPVDVQAAVELQNRLAAGIAVTSLTTASLNATYALDQTTLDQIGSVARDAAAGLGLPGETVSFTYPDITGTPRTFNEAQVISLYKAMRDLVLKLNTQAALMAHGAPPSWPAQTASVV